MGYCFIVSFESMTLSEMMRLVETIGFLCSWQLAVLSVVLGGVWVVGHVEQTVDDPKIGDFL